jgi:hypothetical protein
LYHVDENAFNPRAWTVTAKQGCQMVFCSCQKSQFSLILESLGMENIIRFHRHFCILWSFGIFGGHLVYFVVIWNILWPFDIYFPILVYCAKKNLATLLRNIVEIHAQTIFDQSIRFRIVVETFPGNSFRAGVLALFEMFQKCMLHSQALRPTCIVSSACQQRRLKYLGKSI